jgi:hypothetical protein
LRNPKGRGTEVARVVAVAAALAAVGATALLVPGRAEADQVRLSCRQVEVFTGEVLASGVLYLARQPVVSASDAVEIGGETLARDVDYTVDYLEGIVYLSRRPENSAVVRVSYSVLPFDLKLSYRLRDVGEGRQAASAPVAVGSARSKKSGYDLRASGSKTISVEAGSLIDPRVSQALSLTIAGKVSEGVEVKGSLSDKDMTLGQLSATSELRDLDRVFMEVRCPRAYARVGDLEIDEAPGELLAFRRNLTGFLGDASFGGEKILVSGAQARTRYASAEIAGQEGISGPYVVKTADGDLAEIVTNSEKIWLDGEPMKRGRGADYVIDYERAEIYFNPSRIVRDGARIVADYENRDDGGDQQFYYVRSSASLGERSRLAVTFLNETGGQAAADTVEAEAASAGTARWADGAKFVGLGSGDYVRVTVDSVVYYEYAGEGLGEYDVTFTWVGEGAGTYSYVHSDRWNREVHVYTGSGAYLDKIRALPEVSSQVIHVAASTRPSDWLELTSEAARSKGHKQAAGGQWQMSEDAAYTVGARSSISLPEVAGRAMGAVEIAAKRRSIGDGYLAVARIRSPGTLDSWAQDPGGGWEATNEISLAYRLGENLKTSCEIGSMGTASGDSRRRKATFDLGNSRLGLSASAEAASLGGAALERRSERTAVGIHVPVRGASLEVGRRSSLRDGLVNDQATMVVEYYSLARMAGRGGSIALSLSRSGEQRGAAADSLDAYSSSLDGKLEVEAGTGKRLSVRGQVAHRRLAYQSTAGVADNAMTSADVGLSLRDLSFVSSLAMDYGLANTLTSVYSTKLVRVGSGSDYDSAGSYVPGEGEYELTREETGKQPVARMKAAFTLETGLRGKLLVEKSLSSRTRLEIEGESSGGSSARLALPDPSYVLGGDEVVLGRAALTEEVVVSRTRGLTFSMSARASRISDARCAGRTQREDATQVVGRVVNTSLPKTAINAEARIGSNKESFESSSGKISSATRAWAVTASLERTVTDCFRARLAAGLAGDHRDETRSDLTETNLSPGFTLFLGGLRCDGGLVARRLVRSDNASINDINTRNSVDWNSRLNLRRGRYASLALEYLGRKARGTGAVHNVKASLSATF